MKLYILLPRVGGVFLCALLLAALPVVARAGVACTYKDAAIQVKAGNPGALRNQELIPATYFCERSFNSGERSGSGSRGGREGRGGGAGLGGGRAELAPSMGATNAQQQLAATVCPAVGNPIIIGTGNKIERESDFGTTGEMPLHLERVWNHHFWDAVTLFGFNWLTNFDYRLSFGSSMPFFGPSGSCYARPGIAECTTAASNQNAWAHRPDGRMIKLVKAGDGVYYEDKESPLTKMIRQADGTWLLTFEDNLTELYSRGGYPLWIQDEHGVRWTYAYGGLNGTQVQRVTHPSERSVQFIWIGSQLREVRDPAGNPYIYTYQSPDRGDGLNLLKSVTTPGNPATTVTYHYAAEPGETVYAFSALTGKSVNGVRYSYFAYDEQMRAISTEHAGGIERNTMAYTVEGDGRLSVLQTNPLNKQATYVFKDGKLLSVTGHASASCPLTGKQNTYDAYGYLDVATDFSGNRNDYDYNAAGQLMRLVEGAGSPEARTTDYMWDFVKNRVAGFVVSDASGPAFRTDYTFTADGRLETSVLTNLSSKVSASQGRTRTTRYSYSKHPNGLLSSMSIDGPLASDTVTYKYATTGDLLEVKNGLEQKTLYMDYNAFGLPGTVTGPNGDVVNYLYDARGRMTDYLPIVNGIAQGTHISYDGRGLVSGVQSADGRNVTREYDVAGRLQVEYEQEATGTYAFRHYSYNDASLVTSERIERATLAELVPATPSAPVVPGQSTTGSYTITWATTLRASTYRLEESANGAAWGVLQDSQATSLPISGKAAGTYSYRVFACNKFGCSPASLTSSVTEYDPPAAPAWVSAPAVNEHGSYTVSWAAVTEASYELQEYTGSSWNTVYSGSGTSFPLSRSIYQTHYYRANACNIAGLCSTSPITMVSATVYGAEYVGQSIPGIIPQGATQNVVVYMKNTGNTTWTDAAGFRLGSQNPGDNMTWGLGRVGVPGAVAPGQTAAFNFNIVAPGSSGARNFQWRMVRDGHAWFGAQTPNAVIDVAWSHIYSDLGACAIYIGQGACSATLYFNSTRSDVQVWVSNLDGSGMTPWYISGTASGAQTAPWITPPGRRFHLVVAGATINSIDVGAYYLNEYPPQDPPICHFPPCDPP